MKTEFTNTKYFILYRELNEPPIYEPGDRSNWRQVEYNNAMEWGCKVQELKDSGEISICIGQREGFNQYRSVKVAEFYALCGNGVSIEHDPSKPPITKFVFDYQVPVLSPCLAVKPFLNTHGYGYDIGKEQRLEEYFKNNTGDSPIWKQPVHSKLGIELIENPSKEEMLKQHGPEIKVFLALFLTTHINIINEKPDPEQLDMYVQMMDDLLLNKKILSRHYVSGVGKLEDKYVIITSIFPYDDNPANFEQQMIDKGYIQKINRRFNPKHWEKSTDLANKCDIYKDRDPEPHNNS